mgnify:CR=1 FL=1
MSLREKATAMNGGQGIDFMDGRTKGDVKSLNGKIVEVNDYSFLKGDDGDYVVFTTKQDPDHFYFGAMVMTDNFKKFTEADKLEIQKDGIPVMFEEKKNKKGNRTYQAITFYP